MDTFRNNVRIYVVSLEGSLDRRQSIKGQLDDLKLPFEFVDAVLGRDLAPQELKRYQSNQRQHAGWARDLSPGEVGCALSHQKVYERMLADGVSRALILEDDVTLTPGFAAFFALLSTTDPFPVNSVVMLGGGESVKQFRYVITAVRGGVRVGSHSVIRRCIGSDQYLWGTCCYAIDALTARKLRELNSDLKGSADNWGFFKSRGAYRSIHLAQPWLVVHPEQGASQSMIEAERAILDAQMEGNSAVIKTLRIGKKVLKGLRYACTYPLRYF